MAANPVPFIGVIAMLGTDKPLRKGALYVVTMVVVVVAVGVFSLVVLNEALAAAGSSGSGGGPQVLFGFVFLSVFLLQWRAKPKPGHEGDGPGWMKMMDRGSWPGSVQRSLPTTG